MILPGLVSIGSVIVVIKLSCCNKGNSPPKQITSLPRLVARDPLVVKR